MDRHEYLYFILTGSEVGLFEEFIDKIIEVFDGLVGWLSYFGYWYATQGYRVKNLDIVLKFWRRLPESF